MKYRRLGDAGVKVSEVSLGGWLTFGSTVEREAAAKIFNAAFDLGINFFDNANAYARGRCEESWGELLKERRRDDYVLATKVFFPVGDGPNDKGLSRKHIMEQCHASLKRLRTDYVDLYQAHRYDEESSVEEVVRAMDDLVRQGKVIYWGFSEWPVERVEEALRFCGDRYHRPKSSQPCYNLLHRQPEKELFPLCAKSGIGQIVFSPIAQGVLSGKYKPGQPLPAESRAADDRSNQFIKGMIESQPLLQKVQKLDAIARQHNCTMSQLALAWILSHPEVSSVITGATRPEQLIENAKAVDVKLDAATVERIEQTLT